MNTCRICYKPLPANSRKCPHCGAGTIMETVDCTKCGAEVDMALSFCPHCGTQIFSTKKKASKIIFDNPQMDKLEIELFQRFNKAFQNRLSEEHAIDRHGHYMQRLQKSGFQQSIEFRIKQLSESAEKFGIDKKKLKQEQDRAFEELIDFFIIRHCTDFNETHFQEKILKYQGLQREKINLAAMMADYLDFDRADLNFYTDFGSMPASKLKNAADSFLFPKKGEAIFLICDLSVLGNCKEGFALTSKGLYWKMLLEKPQRVYYHKLKDIKREESWITINGIFFNSNKPLNLKLIRLLKKLRELFDERTDQV